MSDSNNRPRLLVVATAVAVFTAIVFSLLAATHALAAAPAGLPGVEKQSSNGPSGAGVLAGTNTSTSTTTPSRTPTFTRTPTAVPSPTCPTDYSVTQVTSATMIPGSTLVSGSQCDDCIASVSLPFSYTFYDRSFTGASVAANGQLVFSTPADPEYSNFCLPDFYSNYAIFPLWNDITMLAGYEGCTYYPTGCGVFTSVTGTTGNRIFAIEWRALTFADQLPVNFEVLLYENQPRFDLIYAVTQPGYTDQATIGSQKGLGSLFTNISCPDDPIPLPDGTGFTLVYGLACPTATPTNGPTNTPTFTPTITPTNAPTNTATNTAIVTNTPTNSATGTPTSTRTNTPTNVPSNTSTYTPTNTFVPTSTPTGTSTYTPTFTPVPSNTPTTQPTNTATATATATTGAGPVTVVGHVTLQSRGNPPSSRWVIPVNGSLVLAGNLASLDYTATTDQSGFFTVTTDLPPGLYTFWIKSPIMLANSGTATLLTGINQVDMGTLRAGDANNDNCVRITDFNILKVSYGRSIGDPGYDPRADFNGDTTISILDFNLLKVNYSFCGAAPITTPTPTATVTQTSTPTFTPTFTSTTTPTSTSTPTNTPTNTATDTPTDVPTNTPTSTPTDTPTSTNTPITSATLVGHVTILGRSPQPNPRQSVPITLTLRSVLGGPDLEFASTTDQSGFFTVTVPLPDVYDYRVKNPQTLANSGTVTLLPGTNQVEMGGLREGDANNDNCVRITDFNILKVSYGRSVGDPGYDPRADFNGDTTISILDFNLLKVNYSFCGSAPISPGDVH